MMKHSASRFPVMFLLLVATSAAQLPIGQSPSSVQHVRVTVAFAGGGCDPSARVTFSGDGGIAGEGQVGARCIADLDVIPGTYRVTVSLQGLERIDGESVEINSSGVHDVEVKVRHAAEADQRVSPAANALVAAADINIPASARKEFDKAVELMAKENWPKAFDRLNRAIVIYPNYASAYNNLGIVYGHMNQPEQEFNALKKAISINDHCAPAYVNLARMNITANNFSAAENLLSRAATYDPTDATTLVLLSYVEFTDRHFGDVIATARKAHSLSQNHAFVHWMAARALEQNPNGAAERQTELKLFLEEEPTGERAEKARHELAKLLATNH